MRCPNKCGKMQYKSYVTNEKGGKLWRIHYYRCQVCGARKPGHKERVPMR